MDGEHGIEQVGEPDALGLGHESKQVPIAVEAPGAARLDHLEARLVFAKEQLSVGRAQGVLVRKFDRIGAEPLDTDDRNEAVGRDAADGGGRTEILKRGQIGAPELRGGACGRNLAGGWRLLPERHEDRLTQTCVGSLGDGGFSRGNRSSLAT